MSSKSWRSRHLIALTVVLAFIVAACGDEGGNGGNGNGDFEPVELQIGTLLPQTGRLSSIYEALLQPVEMAAAEINELHPGLISLTHADGGTDPAVAEVNVDQFLTGAFAAFIGAADSGSSSAIVDKVQEAQVVMCSPSNTGSALSAFEPYYIRTAPHDGLQSSVLGDLIIGDGHTSVAVVWRTDTYGVGFGEALAAYLSEQIDVPFAEGYDQNASSFSDLMDSVAASGAEALAMITFDEGGQMVLDMQGRFDGQVYVADGFVDTVGADQLGGQVELLEGFRGTYPSAAPATGEATFGTRFAEFAPGVPTIFSAHSYDCMMTIVLAAQKAQSADPTVLVDEIVGITGPPGTKCNRFEACMTLLSEGTEIDYDGASGGLDFLPNGEPGAGTYDLFEFGSDGEYSVFDQVEISTS